MVTMMKDILGGKALIDIVESLFAMKVPIDDSFLVVTFDGIPMWSELSRSMRLDKDCITKIARSMDGISNPFFYDTATQKISADQIDEHHGYLVIPSHDNEKVSVAFLCSGKFSPHFARAEEPFLKLIVKLLAMYGQQLHALNHYVQIEADAEIDRRQLESIAMAQDTFIAGTRATDVFSMLLKHILEITGSKFGFIGEVLLDENGQKFLRSHAISNIAWNEETHRFYEEHRTTGMDFRNLQTLFGAVMLTETPVISNDPANDSRSGGLPDGHPRLERFLGIPIRKSGSMIGMVGMANSLNAYSTATVNSLLPLMNTCANIMLANKVALLKQSAENDLRDNVARIELLNRNLSRSNEDLSQFAYIASHDLQTPLRHIATYLDFIAEDVQTIDAPSIHEHLAIAQKSVGRMRSMIDDILAFARAGSQNLQIQSHSLIRLVNDARMSLPDSESANLEIKIMRDAPIHCDKATMILVFANILHNAIKYARPGVDPCVVLTAEESAKNWKLTFADNGVGIAPVHREHVFKMFQRLPETMHIPGTGIGLAICRTIVERHGGKIEITASEKPGASIVILLPHPENKPTMI